MKGSMALRILLSSLRHRQARLGIAVLAIALGASLVAAFLNIAFGMRERLGEELRAYGANILLVSKTLEGGTRGGLSEKGLEILDGMASKGKIVGSVPYLYLVVEVDGNQVVLVGTWVDQARKVNPWWKVEGRWIEDRGDMERAMVGANVAERLRIKPRDPLTIQYQGKSWRVQGVGVLNTGGSEDNQVLVSLKLAQEIGRLQGMVSMIHVSALAGKRGLGALATELEKALPMARARTIQQVAQAEANLLQRLELLLAMLAILVLVASGLGVAATMMTSVLERVREIGLMKALGAGKARIAILFLAEAGSIGLVGGILGYGLGFLIAQVVARQAFGAAIPFTPLAIPITLVSAVAVILVAVALPVRRANAIDPAIVLRGE